MSPSIPKLVAGAAGLLLAPQLIPYGVDNPPVVQEPAWADPQTEALARRACFDCHSNEVEVPWYGHVAPVKWALGRHVRHGRSDLNLSEMHRPQEEAHESGEKVREGDMPPEGYMLLHPEARLDPAERAALARGLDATLGTETDDHHD